MSTLQELLESQQELEVEPARKFMVGMAPQVLNFILDFPTDIQAHLPQVKPEYFGDGPEKLVFAYLIAYFEAHGVVPTRDALRDVLDRALTMDDPFEEVHAIINRGSDPRETPHIKASFTEWLKNRAYAALFADTTLAAHIRGNYEVIHKILETAQGVGISSASTQITIADLMAKTTQYDWLIEGVLLKRQPAVVGAPQKTMKTSLSLDMAVSISTGTKFLGKYKAHRSRVLYYGGESWDCMALRNQIAAITKQRGISTADMDGYLSFDPKLPRLTNAGDLATLRQALIKGAIDVVFIDPLYLCLTADSNLNATNIFDMGKALSGVGRVCGECGATLVLLHHFNRKGTPGARPTLNDLSFAGAAEFCRQHILLSRRRPYEHNGIHELYLTMGREGSSDQLDLTINEGSQNDRKWEVTVEAGTSGAARQSKKEQKLAGKAEGVVDALHEILAAGDEPTKNKIRERLNISGDRLTPILQYGIEEGMIEMASKGGRTVYYPSDFTPSDGTDALPDVRSGPPAP